MGGLCAKPKTEGVELPGSSLKQQNARFGSNSGVFERKKVFGESNNFEQEKNTVVKDAVAQLFTELETMPAFLKDNDIKEIKVGQDGASQFFSEVY